MMMQALQAGGMEIVSSPESERIANIEQDGDYHPNPGGRFELTAMEQCCTGFPDPKIYDNKVIKVFPDPWGPLCRIVAGDYKIIWLHRQSTQRWASFFRAHEKQPLLWCGHPDDVRYRHYRDLRAQEALGIVLIRSDCIVARVSYDYVLEHAGEVFDSLAEAGWPIDPEAAARIPRPELNRFGQH